MNLMGTAANETGLLRAESKSTFSREGRSVKTLNIAVKNFLRDRPIDEGEKLRVFTWRGPGCDNRSESTSSTTVSDLSLARRHNVLTLFHRFAEAQMRAGVPPKGLEQAFAQHLQVSPSMWCQIKSSRPIGDKLARQIEAACRQVAGWLDEERAGEGLTTGEQRFLALALQAWRTNDGAGRKQLTAVVKDSVTR